MTYSIHSGIIHGVDIVILFRPHDDSYEPVSEPSYYTDADQLGTVTIRISQIKWFIDSLIDSWSGGAEDFNRKFLNFLPSIHRGVKKIYLAGSLTIRLDYKLNVVLKIVPDHSYPH
jgi:hypothetical protein